MNKYAIFRHNKTKFKSFKQISDADKHNSREIKTDNANPTRPHHRLVGGGKKTEDILKSKLEEYGIKPRANAALGMEYVMSFSPDMTDKISLKEWVKANIAFMQAEHGVGLLTLDLHLDESTPHIHCICAPLIEKEVRGKMQMRLAGVDFWKGKDKLSARQDRYAEAMSKFGLERGIKGSTAHHKAIKEYYKELNHSIEKSLQYVPHVIDESPGIFNLRKKYKSISIALKQLTKRFSKAAGQVVSVVDRNKLLKSEIERLKHEISFRDQKLHHNHVNKIEDALKSSNDRVSKLEEMIKNQGIEHDMTVSELNNKINLQDKLLDKYSYHYSDNHI